MSRNILHQDYPQENARGHNYIYTSYACIFYSCQVKLHRREASNNGADLTDAKVQT